jgi:hypothetical protein
MKTLESYIVDRFLLSETNCHLGAAIWKKAVTLDLNK